MSFYNWFAHRFSQISLKLIWFVRVVLLSIMVQWKPQNVITLAQRETDYNNRLDIISKLTWMSIRYERVIWDLSIWINSISLSGTHYTNFVIKIKTFYFILFFSNWKILQCLNDGNCDKWSLTDFSISVFPVFFFLKRSKDFFFHFNSTTT